MLIFFSSKKWRKQGSEVQPSVEGCELTKKDRATPGRGPGRRGAGPRLRCQSTRIEKIRSSHQRLIAGECLPVDFHKPLSLSGIETELRGATGSGETALVKCGIISFDLQVSFATTDSPSGATPSAPVRCTKSKSPKKTVPRKFQRYIYGIETWMRIFYVPWE